jgi:lipoprotein-anchoring transpeptidase ErfK/SrfK
MRTNRARWPRYLFAAAGTLVVLIAAAIAATLTLGRPGISVSRSPSASQTLVRVRVSGLGARLSGLHARSDGHDLALVDEARGVVPAHRIAQDQMVRISATAASPAWLRWLVGPAASATIEIRAPSGQASQRVLLSSGSGQLAVRFDRPVSVVDYRFAREASHTVDLRRPSAVVELPVPSGSRTGLLDVSAAPLPWEQVTARPNELRWFTPAMGGAALAVAEPAPGSSTAAPASPITITFAQPVSEVLGIHRPSVTPPVAGSWSEPDPYTLSFTPSGFGFGPDTTVTVGFDRPISVLGGAPSTDASSSTSPAAARSFRFDTSPGSILRLEQLLAELHYLPLRFVPATGAAEPTSFAGELATVSHPLPGSFSWRWPSTPASLRAEWAPGSPNLMLEGALMAFDSTLGNYDGYRADAASVAQLADAPTWDALARAAVAGHMDPSGYSYVFVDQTTEQLTLWEDGKVVLTSPTNTGIAADPTQNGTFPIYLRFVENYMNGTNPDGSKYHDLVHWINYFNGGDAVHGFLRASYGARQSLGCAELPLATAKVAFAHLTIGDLVTVTG